MHLTKTNYPHAFIDNWANMLIFHVVHGCVKSTVHVHTFRQVIVFPRSGINPCLFLYMCNIQVDQRRSLKWLMVTLYLSILISSAYQHNHCQKTNTLDGIKVCGISKNYARGINPCFNDFFPQNYSSVLEMKYTRDISNKQSKWNIINTVFLSLFSN